LLPLLSLSTRLIEIRQTVSAEFETSSVEEPENHPVELFPFTVTGEHYYLDLLFYHRALQCLIAIELKLGELPTRITLVRITMVVRDVLRSQMLRASLPASALLLATDCSHSPSKIPIKTLTKLSKSSGTLNKLIS